MKFCTSHWDSLRQAVRDRGLWQYVKPTGAEAAQSMEPGSADVQDPLLLAVGTIYAAAAGQGGVYLLGANPEGGEYCPLCEVDTHVGPGTDQAWIDDCCNTILAEFRAAKLVPAIQ